MELERVAVVLVEAGFDDEELLVTKMRSLHPDARCVAIGSPRSRSIFDAVCATALDRDGLNAVLSDQREDTKIA
jgi:hypothetical protein